MFVWQTEQNGTEQNRTTISGYVCWADRTEQNRTEGRTGKHARWTDSRIKRLPAHARACGEVLGNSTVEDSKPCQ
jgi:hypothetical protein